MNKRSIVLPAALAASLLVVAVAGFMYMERIDRVREEGNDFFNQGVALYHEKRFEESIAALEQVPQAYEYDWRLPYYKASALTQMKEFESAAEFLEEARAMNGDETRILYALGVVYYKLGQLALSRAHFAAVVEIDPAHEHAKGMVDIIARLEREQSSLVPEE